MCIYILQLLWANTEEGIGVPIASHEFLIERKTNGATWELHPFGFWSPALTCSWQASKGKHTFEGKKDDELAVLQAKKVSSASCCWTMASWRPKVHPYCHKSESQDVIRCACTGKKINCFCNNTSHQKYCAHTKVLQVCKQYDKNYTSLGDTSFSTKTSVLNMLLLFPKTKIKFGKWTEYSLKAENSA